jgi:hypothetical protein
VTGCLVVYTGTVREEDDDCSLLLGWPTLDQQEGLLSKYSEYTPLLEIEGL